MAWADSEGNVVKQLGRSLNMIRLNIEQEDIAGFANHLADAISNCTPYIENLEKYRIPRNIDDESALFDELQAIKGQLLCEMSKKGIYAYVEEAPGDAGSLAVVDE